MSRKRHLPLNGYSYVFLAPEGTLNTWELRFGSAGPVAVRGQSDYFDHYLTLVRLARKYHIRYIFCTTAFEKLERMPRALRPYVVPGAMPFASPDIFGVLTLHHSTLEDRVRHYARCRYLSRWLLIDSTYERRDIYTPEYTSLACDPVEGLGNTRLLARIMEWLDSSCGAAAAPSGRLVNVLDKFSRFSPDFMSGGRDLG
ncbi:MAG: hypothetical protein OZ927_07345 [Alcaligenaceae bacterium]|nr:hypothetical protein [Alcaligenaceae bacterium]